VSDPLEAVTVRAAERGDLPAVAEIEADCFDRPWPLASFESYLDEPAFLVAEHDDAGVVGLVVADVTPNYGRDIGHVKDLAVEPGARGEGVGRLLLRSSLLRLTWQGAAVAKLEVRAGNDAARGLYRSEGFEPLRRVPRYYTDGETALVLVVDLDGWGEE